MTTRKAKLSRAYDAIERRELRGNSYFTGNGEGGIDRSKPCCTVGALVLEAEDQFAPYLDMLFENNQTWLHNLGTSGVEFRNLLEEIYGLTHQEQSYLQSINDEATKDIFRKDDVLFFLAKLIYEEGNKTNG